MQQKTYDFLLQIKVPAASSGGELLGEAIELTMDSLRLHRFITMTEIEEKLAEKFGCTSRSIDGKMRRMLDIAEYRSGDYPNEALENLKRECGIDILSMKSFVYGAARWLLNRELE